MRAKTNITQAIMTVHKALDDLSHDESIRRLEALVQEIHSQKMMEKLDFNEYQRLSYIVSFLTERKLEGNDINIEEQLSRLLKITYDIHSEDGWAAAIPLSGGALLTWLHSPHSRLLDGHWDQLLSGLEMNRHYRRLPEFIVHLPVLPDAFPWEGHTISGPVQKSGLNSCIAACLYHLRTGAELKPHYIMNMLLVDIEDNDHEHAHWFKELNKYHGIINDDDRTREFIEQYTQEYLRLQSCTEGYYRLGKKQNLAKNLRAMGYPEELLMNKYTRRYLLEDDLSL
jgi:hypothetical protein